MPPRLLLGTSLVGTGVPDRPAWTGEETMRAFLASLVATVVIAVGAYFLIGDFQRSVQEAFATDPSVRL